MRKKIIKLIAKILRLDVYFQAPIVVPTEPIKYEVQNVRTEKIRAQFETEGTIPNEVIEDEVMRAIAKELQKLRAIKVISREYPCHYSDRRILHEAELEIVLR